MYVHVSLHIKYVHIPHVYMCFRTFKIHQFPLQRGHQFLNWEMCALSEAALFLQDSMCEGSCSESLWSLHLGFKMSCCSVPPASGFCF